MVSISVSAKNQRQAEFIASVIIKALPTEEWHDKFVETMESGDYETSISRGE